MTIYSVLLVAHIVVIGYWLGSELVINSTFRYVCYRSSLPVGEREALMTHVLNVDQHVRYALVLQAGLGTALATLAGWLPGHGRVAVGALIITGLWLAFIEWVHRAQPRAYGPKLAQIDRGSRYVLLGLLLGIASGLLLGDSPIPVWLRVKLALFAGVITCGVAIRLVLLKYGETWHAIRASGTSTSLEHQLRHVYWQATIWLVVLWLCIVVMVFLSVIKSIAI